MSKRSEQMRDLARRLRSKSIAATILAFADFMESAEAKQNQLKQRIEELERENAELRQEIVNHRERHTMVNIELEEAELRAMANYDADNRCDEN